MAVASDAPRFAPKWPENLPPGQVRSTYDRVSDTLFVNFYGEARPASSEPVDLGGRDYVFVRVDPLTGEVVGLQIESFLAYAVKQHPDWIEALAISDLHGFNDIEAVSLRRRALELAGEHAGAFGLVRDVELMGA